MALSAANVGFLLAGGLLYLAGRRALFRTPAGPKRRRELAASGLVSLLTVSGFALAHLGMNASWTGDARFTNLEWLRYALVFSGAVLACHVLLRIQRSSVDELVVPVAALLCALGLINIYVWETRDANAYVSTVALPAVRDYQGSIAHSRSLAPRLRREILATLRTVPNELEYETGSRAATVLEPRWVAAYNATVRRFAAATVLDPGAGPRNRVRVLHLDDAVSKQLLAIVLGFLSIPLLVPLVTTLRALRAARRHVHLYASGIALLVLVGAMLLTSRSRGLPALLELKGQAVTVFEPLKLALVVALALALATPAAARRARAPVRFVLVAAGLTIAVMIWRDLGAGLALAAVAALMVSLVASRGRRLALVAATVLAVATAPAVASFVDSHLSKTAHVRMEMWADPWGLYERAELQNEAAGVMRRLAGYRGVGGTTRPPARRDRGLAAVSSRGPAPPLRRDVRKIEGELRWRLDALDSRLQRRSPLIPGADPVDTMLLGEAEKLWADLGGFRAARESPTARLSLRNRVEDEAKRLEREADRWEAGSSGPAAPAPDNFQLQRSLFALRAGGLLGVGLGRGRPEMVPGLTEDVAVAGAGEALGAAGVLLIGALLLLLVGRGIELAQRQRSRALGLLAAGLSALLGLQALISLGGVSGILPFTGLTFPFISRSGTALVANLLLLGMLLVVAATAHPVSLEAGARGPRLLRGAGFPAAFGVVLASVVVVQLTGRTVAAGAVLGPLPGRDASFLHASDQWNVPTYRAAPGLILDREGQLLARTQSLGASRSYPNPRLARSLGHTLFQLDLAYRTELTRPQRPSITGPALVTTIDSGAEQALDAAMNEGAVAAGLPDPKALRGAIVLLDVRDGGIVALQSRPTFAPAELIDGRAWMQAEARDRRAGFPYRYLNRAVQGFYPPGSIFKTVTAAGALERGLHTLYSRDFDYRRGSKGRRSPDGVDQLGYWHQLALEDGPPITDGNHPQLDDWRFNLEEAYAWSCNVAFAELGLELGPAELVGFAHRFGFERPLTVPGLGTTVSTLDNDAGRPFASRFLAHGDSNLARTAFGQGQARVTPLQMALVPAAIANGGKIMQPHVVAGWRSSDGRWLRRTRPRVFSDTRLSDVALEELRQMMSASVTYGWAHTASVNPDNTRPGVAGKTGSAEWSEKLDASHSWFIGYFPAESPRLALAVVVERGGAGPTVAARIARHVFADDAVQEYVREARP